VTEKTPKELEELADAISEAMEEGDKARAFELIGELRHAEIVALSDIHRRREEQFRRRTEQG
jgi:hypothetical protein